MQEYELKHHGIYGQKWGIRLYQNPDGSLTAAGRKRYGVGENGTIKDISSKKGLQRRLNDVEKANVKNKYDLDSFQSKRDGDFSIELKEIRTRRAREYLEAGKKEVNDLIKRANDLGYTNVEDVVTTNILLTPGRYANVIGSGALMGAAVGLQAAGLAAAAIAPYSAVPVSALYAAGIGVLGTRASYLTDRTRHRLVDK